MKSDDITVQQLFQDRRQYMVPFYQRAYVWTLTNQWDQLWDDIRSKADSRFLGGSSTPHFLGAVVLDPQPRQGIIGVDTFHIIDGQQRLTTLQFVLKSALLAFRSFDTRSFSEIISGVILNSNPDTMRFPNIEAYKVWPTFRDRHDYKLAMGVDEIDAMKEVFPDSFTQKSTLRKIGIRHPSSLEAIWFFTHKFKRWISEGEPEDRVARGEALVTAILRDIKIVSIVLDSEDDAQIIFETLNGRGAQLYATDLIRNFIFMRADRENLSSESLYDQFWSKFENSYWNEIQRRGRIRKPRLEWFIHAMLQVELQEEIDLGRLYFEYRRYVFSSNEPKAAENQLEILSKYAAQYKELVSGFGDSPIAHFGRRISPFDISTLHPLALLIGTASLPEEMKKNMFDILFSYVVRRAVCGLTAKNYNNVFISIIRNISKLGVSLESLAQSFGSLSGEASRFPGDDEFRNACVTTSIYPGRLEAPKMRAILAELEWALCKKVRTEDVFTQNFSNLDIDHILPKSWIKFWPLSDGSVVSAEEKANVVIKKYMGKQLDDKEELIDARESCLFTLGNLTLLNLSVNREVQNKSFLTKKDILISNTNLRLNVELLGYDDWTEERIKERGKKLADVAVSIWKGLA